MQSQGNLMRDVNYFQQQRWNHAHEAEGGKMKNLITYLKTMKMNTRLDMLTGDGSPSHIYMINYFTKYRNETNQMRNQAVSKN